jgi:hypothetical protein
MARIKVDYNYEEGRQMYRCDKDDKEICENCIHWKYSDCLPTIKSCELHMDSISAYMSCDNFKDLSFDDYETEK